MIKVLTIQRKSSDSAGLATTAAMIGAAKRRKAMAGNRTGESAHSAQRSGTYNECSQIQPFINREELEEGELIRFVDHLQYCESCVDALVSFHYEDILARKAREEAVSNTDWSWQEGLSQPAYKPLNLAGTNSIATFESLSITRKISTKTKH